MKTSYFAKYKEDNGVSIAVGTPRWFNGEQEKSLFPTWDLVNGIHDGSMNREEYEVKYRQILNKLDANEIYEKYKDSVLLCWEKIGEFCHRRIVAEWIYEETGNVVEEYGIWK
jgi:hypothetical protein